VLAGVAVLLTSGASVGPAWADPESGTEPGAEPTPIDLGGVRAEVSTDPQDPTVLTAGLWADTLSGPGTSERNAHRFRYERTIADSTVHVGVVATSSDPDGNDQVALAIKTDAGDDCGSDTSTSGYPATTSAFGARVVVPSGEFDDRDDPCLRAGALDITLSRGTADLQGELPVAIRIVEEAPVGASDLPEPPEVTAVGVPAPAESPATVEGGSSFDDAPDLTTGTVADVVPEGTERLYRVRLGWGQALAVRVDVPAADEATTESFGTNSPDLDLTLFDPVRNSFDGGAEEAVTSGSWGEEPARLFDSTGPVTYLYRFDDVVMSVPGDYWVSLSSAAPADRAPLDIPVELTVEVVGEVGEAPTYASAVLSPGGPGPEAYDAAQPFLLGVDEYGADVSGEPPLPPGVPDAGGSDAAGRSTGRTAAGAVVGAASLACLLAGVVLLRRRRVAR
jgi:hypothetical protein